MMGVGWYVGVSDKGGAAAAWVYMLCAVTVGHAMHQGGREAGSSPRTSMQQWGQAPELVTPGPCR